MNRWSPWPSEDAFIEFGCTVVGPASSLKQGMQLIEEHAVDGAVLDVNLRGEMVFPLADALAERFIPFVYVTGYGKLVRACNHGIYRASEALQRSAIAKHHRPVAAPGYGPPPPRVTYFPERIGIA